MWASFSNVSLFCIHRTLVSYAKSFAGYFELINNTSRTYKNKKWDRWRWLHWPKIRTKRLGKRFADQLYTIEPNLPVWTKVRFKLCSFNGFCWLRNRVLVSRFLRCFSIQGRILPIHSHIYYIAAFLPNIRRRGLILDTFNHLLCMRCELYLLDVASQQLPGPILRSSNRCLWTQVGSNLEFHENLLLERWYQCTGFATGAFRPW